MKVTTLSLLCTVFLTLTGIAQNQFMNDANGRPLYITNNYEIEGSPYWPEKYTAAEITASNGNTYKNVNVKVNLQTNEILYQTDGGEEMVAVMPIRRIRFLGVKTGKTVADRTLEVFGTQPINAPNSVVYEKLDSGKATLLKHIKITFVDSKGYNQASTTRKFSHHETFHLRWPDGSITKLDAGKEAVAAAFKDKEADILAFIEKNKLKARNAEDFRKITAYYNSLF